MGDTLTIESYYYLWIKVDKTRVSSDEFDCSNNNIDRYYEVVFKSELLIFEHVVRSNGTVWETDTYTSNSHLLKGNIYIFFYIFW